MCQLSIRIHIDLMQPRRLQPPVPIPL